jgi:hypothetical protein
LRFGSVTAVISLLTYFPSGSRSRSVKLQEKADGPWTIEVNDAYLTAPDLETAKRLFVEKYDRALVKLSPGAFDG